MPKDRNSRCNNTDEFYFMNLLPHIVHNVFTLFMTCTEHVIESLSTIQPKSHQVDEK